MDFGLRGKIALVLGASQGMGRAAAVALGLEGCDLALAARKAETLGSAAAAIAKECGVRVFHQTCDVTRDEDRESFLAETLHRYERVDILVNNCGGPKPGTLKDAPSAEEWRDGFERSLMQVVKWTQAVVPYMKTWGRIVNIVSTSVKQPIDGLLLSNTLRPGVIGFSKSASRDLAPLGITINSILPGSIRTDRTVELATHRSRKDGLSIEQVLEEKSREIPAGRLGEPEEIGAAVAFLCSRQAAYITGATLVIDGGLTRAV
ncbi:MAG TPA: SDR family oxidoreductase [Planctomycetota bacterium]|jgi:3-oxoacyl-[acyl-carrier protein] reductase|nr:SDR family oxidoreductase [Planctomycetota bacterium]